MSPPRPRPPRSARRGASRGADAAAGVRYSARSGVLDDMGEDAEDFARVVDVVFLDIERDHGLLQSQELPGATGGDHAEDRLDRGAGLLIEDLCRIHRSDALAQTRS